MPDASVTDVVTDAILDGRLHLRQPRKGHRAGTDAILLAAAVPANFEGHLLDVGAGVGTAGLAAAISRPHMTFGLVESDPPTAALARENLTLNRLVERGVVLEADLFQAATRRAAGLFDEKAALAITNPPFFDPRHVRLSPDPGRQAAHAMPQSIAAWITACLALVAPAGTLIMIHRAEALGEILAALAGRAGDVTVLQIHSDRDKPAIRVLVRARKGSRAPLVLAPPLVLNAEGRFTPHAEALHRGTATIAW